MKSSSHHDQAEVAGQHGAGEAEALAVPGPAAAAVQRGEPAVHRRHPPAGVGVVHDVVVDQRGRLEELQGRGRAGDALAVRSPGAAPAPVAERGTEPLAPAHEVRDVLHQRGAVGAHGVEHVALAGEELFDDLLDPGAEALGVERGGVHEVGHGHCVSREVLALFARVVMAGTGRAPTTSSVTGSPPDAPHCSEPRWTPPGRHLAARVMISITLGGCHRPTRRSTSGPGLRPAARSPSSSSPRGTTRARSCCGRPSGGWSPRALRSSPSPTGPAGPPGTGRRRITAAIAARDHPDAGGAPDLRGGVPRGAAAGRRRVCRAGVSTCSPCAATRPAGPAALGRRTPRASTTPIDLVKLVRRLGDFEVGVAAFPDVHPRAGTSTRRPDPSPRRPTPARRSRSRSSSSSRRGTSGSSTGSPRWLRPAGHPGIMPVTNLKQIERFPQLSGKPLPPRVLAGWSPPRGPGLVRRAGVEIATESAQAAGRGAPGCTSTRSTGRRRRSRCSPTSASAARSLSSPDPARGRLPDPAAPRTS